MNERMPQLITKKQLASMLGVSQKTVQRRLHEGAVPPPIRLGAAVRWDLDVVRAWINARCQLTDEPDRLAG